MNVARLLAFALLFGPAAAPVPASFQEPKRYTPTEAELVEIREGLDRLGRAIADLGPGFNPRERDLRADVAVWRKAAEWTVRHGEFFEPKDVATANEAIAEGLRRAESLAKGEHAWTKRTGGAGLGYRSRVDGSVQSYALYVPADLPDQGRVPLLVMLHGRGATITESRFLKQHDGKAFPKGEAGLVLHVFGRTNNAYRWAGEADVFEAIEAVKRNHFVDDRRIALQGFSMGGAGAWHLGLHHPSAWAAVEAGAGFAETREYAKLKDVSDLTGKLLHIYDAADYALNAFNVPMAGYGGEEDPQRRASELITERLDALGFPMTTEGLVTKARGIDFLRVVGAKMGHKVDPESATILKAFRDEHVAKAEDDPMPRKVRFLTYTLKYNAAAWIRVEAMNESYQKTLVEAEVDEDGEVATIWKFENVAVLGVDRQVARTLQIGEQTLPLRDAAKSALPYVYFERTREGWQVLDYEASRRFQENAERRKVHGLQGPIDDAFTGPFLVVRGTGSPWNSALKSWADGRLEAFREVWSRDLRGDLPVKDDVDVTPEDEAHSHLVLLGDPGSNRVLGRLATSLPLQWTRDALNLGGKLYPAADHAPVLIAPNPSHPLRYVVVNGIHTFGTKEFAGTNALLYPRLGDYAVYAIRDNSVVDTGLFDERWRTR